MIKMHGHNQIHRILLVSLLFASCQKTTSSIEVLKTFPVFINTHFNHPWECTPEAEQACEMLADVGIPLGNQAVLMKGVNDDPEIMLDLHRKLLKMRVRPYYIYQADLTKGTNHFRTPVRVGLEIMDKLRGHTSGLAVPYYVIDAPGGGGKIPLLPQYVMGRNGKDIILRNYKYEIYTYPDVEEPRVEQLPVENKYLRKRQNGRRKSITIPDVMDENGDKVPVERVPVEQNSKGKTSRS